MNSATVGTRSQFRRTKERGGGGWGWRGGGAGDLWLDVYYDFANQKNLIIIVNARASSKVTIEERKADDLNWQKQRS